MKSKNYDKVKTYYDMGLWNIGQVRMAVVHRWITAEEYKEITGDELED